MPWSRHRKAFALWSSAFAAAVGGSRHASAQETSGIESHLALEWLAPPECPNRRQVIGLVKDLLGPLSHSERRVEVRGHLSTRTQSTGARYKLELFIRGPKASTRTLDGDDCSRLASAAAFIVALDIDPHVLTRSETPNGSPEEAPLEAPMEAPPGTPPPTPAGSSSAPAPDWPRSKEASAGSRARVEERDGLDLLVAASMLVDVGSLPRPTLGARGSLGLDVGRLGLALDIAGYSSQFTTDGPRRGAGGAYVDLATVGARACWKWRLLAEERACVGGEVGRESTQGINISRPGASTGLWAAAAATLQVRALPTLPLSPVAGVTLVYPLTAPRVTIDEVGTVFEAPILVVRLFLGIEASFR